MNSHTILIDADAMYALTDARDSNHDQAIELYQQLAQEDYRFVCTNTSYYEVLTVLRMQAGHKVTQQFIKESQAGLQLIFVDHKIHEMGQKLFQKQSSKNVSFFDCLNMAMMDQLKIDQIFSFDQDYKKNGYPRFGIDD